MNDAVAYLAITERSYPKKLALTYLEDVRAEFQTSYKRDEIHDPQLRPYQYSEFDRFIERTKKTYQDSRATDNLGRLNDELKDVTQVMTKNIEDLLYRGDSLEKMGEQYRLKECVWHTLTIGDLQVICLPGYETTLSSTSEQPSGSTGSCYSSSMALLLV